MRKVIANKQSFLIEFFRLTTSAFKSAVAPSHCRFSFRRRGSSLGRGVLGCPMEAIDWSGVRDTGECE